MADRYRRQLSSYRPQRLPTPLASRALAEEAGRTETLVRWVRRWLNQPVLPYRGIDRRASERRPFPHVVGAIPQLEVRRPQPAETTFVVAKDLSRSGIGFVHTRAPVNRQLFLTLPYRLGRPICLLTEVRRVQPVRQGLYLIGGRFQQRVDLGEADGGTDRTSTESLWLEEFSGGGAPV